MLWMPKGGAYVPQIFEKSASQSLIFGQSESYQKVNPLFDNLFHMWRMNETGTRVDQVGTLDLIKYNSPTSVAGKIGNATRFPESASSHLYANGSRINPPGQFEITLWLRWFRTNDLGDLDILVEHDNEPTGVPFRLWYNTSSSIYRWSCAGGIPNYTLTRTLNAWVFIDIYHNSITDKTGIAINNSAMVEATATSPIWPGGTNQDLIIGAYSTGATFNDSIDVDCVHVWEGYNLTTAERTYMYNSGNGRELL